MKNLNIKKILISKKKLKKAIFAKKKIEIILKAFNLASKCKYFLSSYNYRNNTGYPLETLNMFNFINSYFYGSCHEISFFMKYLLSLYRIKSKIIHMNNLKGCTHMALIVLFNSKYIFFDPTLNIYFYDKKKILTIKQIKNLIKQNNKIKSNKKISLIKFKTLDHKSHYFFKNKNSFINPKKKYLEYFKKCTIVNFDSNDYSYKKRLFREYGIKDFYSYSQSKFATKNIISVKFLKKGYSILNNNKISSNSILNFQNYIFKYFLNKKNLNIYNFPFLIIDLKLFFKKKKNIKIYFNTGKKEKTLYVKNREFFFNKINNIYTFPVRSISIVSEEKILSYEILTLKSFY
jgi:hypothetical protein